MNFLAAFLHTAREEGLLQWFSVSLSGLRPRAQRLKGIFLSAKEPLISSISCPEVRGRRMRDELSEKALETVHEKLFFCIEVRRSFALLGSCEFS